MISIFINGEWTTQEREHCEVLGEYKITKYHEYHVNMINGGEHHSSEILSKLVGFNVHKDWGVDGSTRTYWSDKELKNEFQRIIQAYPEFLSIIPCDNENRFMIDVRAGCISKFNFEDIKYFCEVRYEDRDRQIEKRLHKLYKKINFHFSWVCSEATLRKIERHVEKNDIRITLELIKEKLSENTKRHKTEQRLVV